MKKKHIKYFLVMNEGHALYIKLESDLIFSVKEGKDSLIESYPKATSIREISSTKAIKFLGLNKPNRITVPRTERRNKGQIVVMKLETKIELPKTKNMKTALQELIEEMEKHSEMESATTIAPLLKKATELLEKEKEQIMDAYIGATARDNKFIDPETYYNQTYNK